ncbi:hypothetical protein [uncultured Rubinisphaera sp.]|uniref:hypothetical protein n=1 Tax=uncultured Rubinisphaera sp. TaxID=1678686 RepID=UPI0030DD34DE
MGLREAICDGLKAKRHPIYIFGEQGRGKSCAMGCLYVSYKETPAVPQWLSLDTFIQQIIKCRTSRDGRCEIPNPTGFGNSIWRSECDWFHIASGCPVLFVDDIGIKPPTDTGLEIAYKLFNQRLTKDKPTQQMTFLSSNLSPEQLNSIYGPRIVSRVCRGTVIRCGGEDRRLKNAKYHDLF